MNYILSPPLPGALLKVSKNAIHERNECLMLIHTSAWVSPLKGEVGGGGELRTDGYISLSANPTTQELCLCLPFFPLNLARLKAASSPD